MLVLVSQKKSPERDANLGTGLARHSHSGANGRHVHYAMGAVTFTTGELIMATSKTKASERPHQTVDSPFRPSQRSRRAVQPAASAELSQALNELTALSKEVRELDETADWLMGLGVFAVPLIDRQHAQRV
jgi:hypothetical protein